MDGFGLCKGMVHEILVGTERPGFIYWKKKKRKKKAVSMAIAIRSETTGDALTDGNGLFTVNKPTSVANSDVLVAVIGKLDDPLITPPVGWIIGNQTGSAAGNDRMGGIYYKIISNAAGEPTSYTFDSGGLNENVGWWIGSLSGVNTGTVQDVPFDEAGAWIVRTNDSSPNTPAVTVTSNGAFALACWAINATVTGTMPGGSWALRAENIGNNNVPVLWVASQTFATSGTSTGSPEITGVPAAAETQVGMFVFRPIVSATFDDTLTLTHLRGLTDRTQLDAQNNVSLGRLVGETAATRMDLQGQVTLPRIDQFVDSAGLVIFETINLSWQGGITTVSERKDTALAYGEQNPTQNETAVSWATWSDGNGGTPNISGNADWGKLNLGPADEARGAVYDFGDSNLRQYTLTQNRYGIGSGTATLQIRGDTTSFAQDDVLPAWESYTEPISRSWRYVQVRVATS